MHFASLKQCSGMYFNFILVTLDVFWDILHLMNNDVIEFFFGENMYIKCTLSPKWPFGSNYQRAIACLSSILMVILR